MRQGFYALHMLHYFPTTLMHQVHGHPLYICHIFPQHHLHQ
eukprot:Gb_22962 [translate_table: standard]